MDRVTLIRSMTSPEADHDRAVAPPVTGYRPSPALVYPELRQRGRQGPRGDARACCRPYVAVPDAPIFASSGYLTPAYDPFAVAGDPNQAGFRVRNLTPPDRLTLERLLRRRDMVKSLDDFAHDVPPTPLTDQPRPVRRAGVFAADLERRPGRVPDRRRARRRSATSTAGRPFGQSCLLARRLVEAGVSFVTLNDRGTGPLGWDTHGRTSRRSRTPSPRRSTRASSALLDDLAERGLLDSTLVVMMGEFGRTPKINPNAGRDHHGRANSVLLAGAGIPGGLVLGQTDAKGDTPADRPVTPADLASVLYHKLGIDPEHQVRGPRRPADPPRRGVQSAPRADLSCLRSIPSTLAGPAASARRRSDMRRAALRGLVGLIGASWPIRDDGSTGTADRSGRVAQVLSVVP